MSNSDDSHDNQSTERVTEDIADNAAAALAGLEELAKLDDGTMKRIEELERKILYRQFYFPGDTAVKRYPGLGTDIPGKVKYDQIPGDRDLFSRWDPRYLDDYIGQAQQQGFHRHFLYFNGTDIQTIDFTEAKDILLPCLINNDVDTTRAGCNAEMIYGILVGLRYMNKVKAFVKEFGKTLGLSEGIVKDILKNGDQWVESCEIKLQSFIGQTRSDFINKDIGYQAYDQKYAFDIAEYAQEWRDAQAKYQEYKNKIWQILKQTNAINICTNNVSGIVQGNATIQQANDCQMRIGDIVNSKDEISSTTKDGTNDQTSLERDNAQNEVIAQMADELKKHGEEIAKYKVDNEERQQSEQITSEDNVQNTSDEKSTNKHDKTSMVIGIILIIIGVVIIIGGVIHWKSSRKSVETIDESLVHDHVDI